MEQLMECDMSYVDAFLKKHADYYDDSTTDSVGAFRAGFNIGGWSPIKNKPVYQVEADDLTAFFMGNSVDVAKWFEKAIAKWQRKVAR